jgi:hypothetical protein
MSGSYVISKHNDGWVVAVDGSMLLICEDKGVAIRAVRDAMRNGPPVYAPELLESRAAAPNP